MKINPLPLAGACLIEPEIMEDPRGSFSRLYCRRELESIGLRSEIAQINHSFNKEKGTLRGLHYRLRPGAEIKMVTCVRGAVFDVIVDIGKGSKTFLKWHGEILSAENKKIMYVPEHCAHGFQTLENGCVLVYFHGGFYDPQYEMVIRYDEPRIGVNWPAAITSMSERDQDAVSLPAGFPGI